MQSLTHQFLTFCRSKPTDEVFDPWNGDECAGRQFLEAQGYPVTYCGVRYWEGDGTDHKMPPAMGEAISWACNESDRIRGPVAFSALADRLEAALVEAR